MPWKECSVVDERVRFVGRLLDGEKMAALCREFAISRKTGYKIFDRYGTRSGSCDRPFPQALALRQPTAAAGGGCHLESQTGKTLLGRAQDPRTSVASLFL